MGSLLEDLLKIFCLVMLVIIVNKAIHGEPQLNITNYTYTEFSKDSDNAFGNASIVMEKVDKVMNTTMWDEKLNKTVSYIFNITENKTY